MAYTAYADYSIYFVDEAEYQFAFGLTNGSGSLRINPVDAAALFGIAWPPAGGPMGSKGFIFIYPYNPNSNISHPAPSGVLLDPAVDFVTVPGQTTNISPTAGPDMILYWAAAINRRGPEYTGADPTLIAPIPQRRWATGFETFGTFETRGSSIGIRHRDSSRVVDGFGIGVRSSGGGVLSQVSLSTSDATGLPSNASWERFYIRIKQFGANIPILWSTSGSGGASMGGRLELNPSGTISLFNIGLFGTATLLGTTPALLIDTWYRIDILIKYAIGLLNGSLRVYFNGVPVASGVVGNGGDGLGTVQNHASTSVLLFTTPHTWEVDFDDWHNAEIPNIGGVETLNSIDWLIGTHNKGVQAYAGTQVNWTPAGLFPALNQYLNTHGSAISIVSTTALATVNLVTNALDYGEAETQDASGIVIGPAMADIIIEAAQSGGAANLTRSGYSVAGGASVMRLQNAAGATSSMLQTYLPTGGITPYAIEPLTVTWEKKNSAEQGTLTVLGAIVQYIGLWGPEDGMEGEDPGLVFNRLMHNCRYPLLGWAIMGPAPDAPVCVVGGTYVGNGTFQTINLVLPAHLLIIRNISGGVPVILNSTMFAPENVNGSGGLAGDIPILGSDDTGQAFFTVVGNGARVNQLSVTYQYFAFCDPGLRYVLNGEFSHGDSAVVFSNLLIDSLFIPQFGLFFQGPASPGGFWLKGPAQTGMEVTSVGGSQLTTAIQFATGSFQSGTDLSVQGNSTAYSMFRTLDGSALTMVQIVTYIGDGVASRIIPLTPVSNRFPLVVIVQRTSGGSGAIYRDPTHAGVNSVLLSGGGNTTTGITAGGVDNITVGILLNANGAVYEVLCIPGSGSGWLNGTFCGPNGIAPGDFWDPDPAPLPPGIAILTEGGLILGDSNPITLLKDVSGIYTLTPGKKNDTMYDRQTGQSSIDMEIPDPTFKTGYIGG